jgi:hypothetical protein
VTSYSRTLWTVSCNGADRTREFDLTGRPSALLACPLTVSSDSVPGVVDLDGLRAYLAGLGWAAGAPMQDRCCRFYRLDFCPAHKDRHGYRIGDRWVIGYGPGSYKAAVAAGEDKDHG